MMWAGQRTWQVFAADNFLGYEYAEDESTATNKAVAKYGAPEKWGIDAYTVNKIKWAEEDQ
jgi:hypothetical protein